MFSTLYFLLIIITIIINRCFNKYNCMASTMTALPRIQISYDAADGLDGENLPNEHDEVQLEDFFWTGSGDGPPDYLKRVHTGLSRGRDMVVKTETVVATVYVDGNNEIDVPICLDCYGSNDGHGGGHGGNWYDTMLGIGYGIDQLPLNYTTNDRRYWLLTVISGFYNIKHKAVLEQKLAQLYRLAFTRQQVKHFGLINGIEEKSSISLLNQSMESLSTAKAEGSLELADLAGNYSNDAEHKITIWPHIQRNSQSEWFSSSEEEYYDSNPVAVTTAVYLNTSEISEQMLVEESRLEDIPVHNPTVTWEYIDTTREQLARSLDNSLFLEDVHIQIIIHNFTQLSEDDLKHFNGLNTAIYDFDNTEKLTDDRPIANQTELIYTVFVNGRPVLAVPAANDMKLVSETEVSNIVGKKVFMKAEPYLREPQATPLSPATRSGATLGFIDSIQSNSLLVLISTVALLLLLLLMLALLLMGRNNVLRRNSADAKRISNRNELLREQKMPEDTAEGGGMTVASRDVGTQNFSFENELGYSPRNAQLYFPAPPMESRHKANNNTSSDNTSDSSVYCPLQLDNIESHRKAERKSKDLVEQKQTNRNRGQYDRAETMSNEETIYTTIMSEKKRKRHLKRKYLSENRVGSLETSPVVSGQHLFADEIVNVPTSRAAAVTYENLKSNKHGRNKAVDKREQSSDKSSDAGSIGSFLSMQSIRPFPKSSLPEPLSRVLEPVFVTYYDNLDNNNPQNHTGENIKEPNGKHYRNYKGTSSSLIANLERFPSPKVPKKYIHLKSQSDNPDPGVLGPIVWERHKSSLNKANVQLNNDNNMYGRIQQDPAALRTHYEGLLEGAMQIYTKQNHDAILSSSEQNISSKEPLTKRENRGSSAGTTAILGSGKSYIFDRRPSTAVPAKLTKSNSSTQPPSPTIDAWYLGSNDALHSDLERPFSAGTYHNISPHSMTKQYKILPRPNAAPLIAAIQHELHKYQQNEHKTTFNYK